MKKQLQQAPIFIKKSTTHGYGVFARKSFKKGEIIEECYIIISRGGDRKLEDYYFDVNGKYGLFTGCGIIYNHSEEPNADYYLYPKRSLAVFKANRAIRKGDEIFISYGKKWFTTRNMQPKVLTPKRKKKR